MKAGMHVYSATRWIHFPLDRSQPCRSSRVVQDLSFANKSRLLRTFIKHPESMSKKNVTQINIYVCIYLSPSWEHISCVWSFIWTYVNSPHQRLFWANLGWNWSCGSKEQDIWISFTYFRYYLPLETGVVLRFKVTWASHSIAGRPHQPPLEVSGPILSTEWDCI